MRTMLEFVEILINNKVDGGEDQIVKTIIDVWCYLDSVFQDPSLDSIV